MDPWNTALEVGHAEMDGEHRGLFGLTLQAAGCLERNDPGGVAGALSALFTTSAAHFEREEALMVESGYPGLKEHREAHGAFMVDFGKLRSEIQSRGLSPLFRLWFGSRFQDWLRFHIRGQDVQFYRHLRQWQEAQARQAEARLIAEAKAAEVNGVRPGKA
jgi:hemerythrin-like metal-binding protein